MAHEDDPFQATMRIDIPPDLLEQMNMPHAPAGEAPVRRAAHTTVIRIPGKKVEAATIGGPDFHELLQNIYDAVLITDFSGAIVSANIRSIQFLIYSRDELCKRHVLDLISGASETLLSTILETLQNDRFVLIQACLMRKDNSMFPAEISVNRLHLTGKDYLSFFIRDITLRKEAEERLRTGYNALQNSASGIAIADVQAGLGYCNPALLKLWGLDSPDEVKGKTIRDFLVDESISFEIIETVVRGDTWSGEIEMKRKGGAIFFVQASVGANLNPDGDIAGMVFSLQDVTFQKQAQIQLARYAEELREKNLQMENDLLMAREMQQTFLPREYPVFPRSAPPEQSALRFSHVYYPSSAVGGDFFDILPLSDTQAGIFISDVMGHGTRAALVVATIQGLIEQLSSMALDPGAFLTQLNRTYYSIFSKTSELMFATALYLVIDVKEGILLYANAGHPYPFLMRPDADEVSELVFTEGSKGPAVGLFGDSVYTNARTPFNLGDRLLLYTDGLSEAKISGTEYYESGRMVEMLRAGLKQPPARLLNELISDARQFMGIAEFDDDVCLLAAERTAVP